MAERRQHKRFKTKDHIYAVYRDRFCVTGQVIDISEGGLAFHYIDSKEELPEKFDLNIYLGRKDLFIVNLKVRRISDIPTAKRSGIDFIETKRCGVSFNGISSRHISQIKHIIEKHTVHEASEES